MTYKNYFKKENIDNDNDIRSRSASNGMETSIRKNYRNTPASISEDTDIGTDNPSVNKKQWIHRWISFKGKKKVVPLIMLVVIIGSAYGVYEKFFNLSDEERAQKELAAAVAAVGQLMMLPEGDEPVLAIVTDAEALIAQQLFFSGAINGDQLLLFPRSLKAVIYSPSRDKIINAGPIEQQPPAVVDKFQVPSSKSQINSNDQTQNIQNTLTVEVRNGTGRSGLAAQVAENLKAAGFDVVVVADAKDKNYAKTILAMNTKSAEKKKLATSLVAQLEAELMDKIPEGEKNTDADALIIIGGE